MGAILDQICAAGTPTSGIGGQTRTTGTPTAGIGRQDGGIGTPVAETDGQIIASGAPGGWRLALGEADMEGTSRQTFRWARGIGWPSAASAREFGIVFAPVGWLHRSMRANWVPGIDVLIAKLSASERRSRASAVQSR